MQLALLLIACHIGVQAKLGGQEPTVKYRNQKVTIKRRGESFIIPAPSGAKIFEQLHGEVCFSIQGDALYKVGFVGPPQPVYRYPSYHDPKALVVKVPVVLFVDRFYPPTASADDEERARISRWRRVRQLNLQTGEIRTLGTLSQIGTPISIIAKTAYFAVPNKDSRIELWKVWMGTGSVKRALVGVVQAGAKSQQVIDKLDRLDISGMRMVCHSQQIYFAMGRTKWLVRRE